MCAIHQGQVRVLYQRLITSLWCTSIRQHFPSIRSHTREAITIVLDLHHRPSFLHKREATASLWSHHLYQIQAHHRVLYHLGIRAQLRFFCQVSSFLFVCLTFWICFCVSLVSVLFLKKFLKKLYFSFILFRVKYLFLSFVILIKKKYIYIYC